MKKFNNTFSRERSNDSRKRDFKRRGPRKRQFGNRDRERPQMYEVTCSDCGKRCEVPFNPTGDKPVYCSQCFSNRRGGPISRGSGRGGYQKPRSQDRRMFDAICDKCGKRFGLPFRPTGEKEVYCNECFGGSGGSSSKSNNNEQFEMLNAKLDRIIKVLIPVAPAKKEKKEKTTIDDKKTTVKKKEKVVKKKKAKKDKKKK